MMKFMVDKKLWSQPDMQAMFDNLIGDQGLILFVGGGVHLLNLFQ